MVSLEINPPLGLRDALALASSLSKKERPEGESQRDWQSLDVRSA